MPNYPVTERVGTAFKLIHRQKNLPSCAHVLHKTLNLVIAREAGNAKLSDTRTTMYMLKDLPERNALLAG